MAGNRFTNLGDRCWSVEREAVLARGCYEGTGGPTGLVVFQRVPRTCVSTASVSRCSAQCDEAAHTAG